MLSIQSQEDFLKGEEGRPQGEQRPLPRPPAEMRQALPTDPQAVSAFNDSMAAYYHQVAHYFLQLQIFASPLDTPKARSCLLLAYHSSCLLCYSSG